MAHPLFLLPETDVVGGDGAWVATGPRPWLRAPGLERLAGRWVAFTYRQGLLDEMVRPLVRFRLGDGDESVMPLVGAPFGGARWVGRMPAGTVAVAFCPARRTGPFAFDLLAARRLPRALLMAQGLARRPGMALTALGARLIGARAEARHCLAFAVAGTPARHYGRWKRAGERLAAPLPAVVEGPTVHLLVRPGPPAALARTRAALAAQPYPRWRLWQLDAATGARRVDELGTGRDWLAVAAAGDRPFPAALLQLVAAAARDPSCLAVLGDEEAQGRYRPRPDWSPLDGYGGTSPFVRLAALPSGATLDAVAALPALLAGVPPPRVVTLHRPVWRRDRAPARAAPPIPPTPTDPFITVVIPFRDRPALLAACLDGLARTAGRLEIVLVDNGSTNPAACRLATQAAADGAVLLHRPGPFNYAALCNAGAAAGTAPLLLFLNNDVVPRAPDWLSLLAAQAQRPDVGAVGARLLFPDGRLQHGGVVVGMGGTALHLGRGGPDGPDPLDLLDRPRRVGAVTGAVLMVERTKFDAVGGFDAAAFPVLLNDIDLCLRLAARGWSTFHEARAVLVHHESASRSRGLRPLATHAAERARFVARWPDVLRHDPGFHPALSLWSILPALG